MTYRVLIVEDNEEHAQRIAETTRTMMIDPAIDFAEERMEALKRIQQKDYDVIILDLDLKGISQGRLFLEALKSREHESPGVIIVSHLGGRPIARELMADFPFVAEVIPKGDLDELPKTYRIALERSLSITNEAKSKNIFIIHGRDEAKWRELKDLVREQLGLNPIVLTEQPDTGAQSVIEKFELYARKCCYAIAVFTPDDEVKSDDRVYLQARPNVIYEVGWFCGNLGRTHVMLLLKSGTSMFSDFGGIIQKRFTKNVAERLADIQRDLAAVGVLHPS